MHDLISGLKETFAIDIPLSPLLFTLQSIHYSDFYRHHHHHQYQDHYHHRLLLLSLIWKLLRQCLGSDVIGKGRTCEGFVCVNHAHKSTSAQLPMHTCASFISDDDDEDGLIIIKALYFPVNYIDKFLDNWMDGRNLE